MLPARGGTRSQRLCGPPDGNQAIKPPASQRTSQSSLPNHGTCPRGGKQEIARVQASGGRALAQTLCARRGPLPELLPQPESVNMILLLSRAETLLTLGRESLVLVGTVANSGDPSHQTADSQTADSRQHRGERSAGMLEMSRRVGGAESRCQAQSVGHAHGWAGWMGAPSVLLFLLKRTEEAHF